MKRGSVRWALHQQKLVEKRVAEQRELEALADQAEATLSIRRPQLYVDLVDSLPGDLRVGEKVDGVVVGPGMTVLRTGQLDACFNGVYRAVIDRYGNAFMAKWDPTVLEGDLIKVRHGVTYGGTLFILVVGAWHLVGGTA